MCIIHEKDLHYVYQNIMEAFEQSKMLSELFLRRVGNLICSCQNNLLFDSHTLIPTQRALYTWFDEACKSKRLACFQPIVDEFKVNGKIDSSTKIAFLNLLKDLEAYDFSKLRDLVTIKSSKSKTKSSTKAKSKSTKRQIFYTKLVKLKFDLKLCSIKEFCDLVAKIDNCAIKYIQVTNKCKITLRDPERLGIRHFMGEIDATIEAASEKNLVKAELSLKRLADAVHYRLTKQMPSSDSMVGGNSFTNLKILLQSPPHQEHLDTTSSDVSSTQNETTSAHNMTRSFMTTESTRHRRHHNTEWSETDISKKAYRNMSFVSDHSSASTMNNNHHYHHNKYQKNSHNNYNKPNYHHRQINQHGQTHYNRHNDSSLLYNNSFAGNSYGSTPLTSSPMSSSPNSSALKNMLKTRKNKKPTNSAVHAASKKLSHLINNGTRHQQPSSSSSKFNNHYHQTNRSQKPTPTKSYNMHKRSPYNNYNNQNNNYPYDSAKKSYTYTKSHYAHNNDSYHMNNRSFSSANNSFNNSYMKDDYYPTKYNKTAYNNNHNNYYGSSEKKKSYSQHHNHHQYNNQQYMFKKSKSYMSTGYPERDMDYMKHQTSPPKHQPRMLMENFAY